MTRAVPEGSPCRDVPAATSASPPRKYKTLTTGDHFGMKDNLVYCRVHFETLVQGEYHPQLNYAELAAKGGGLALPYFNGTGTVQKGRPRKRKSPAMGIDIGSYNSGEMCIKWTYLV